MISSMWSDAGGAEGVGGPTEEARTALPGLVIEDLLVSEA